MQPEKQYMSVEPATIRVIPVADLSPIQREAIITLCSRAFEEDYGPSIRPCGAGG